MQCSKKCESENIKSSNLFGAFRNGGIKECLQHRIINRCGCAVDFIACDLQPDDRDPRTKCKACVQKTYRDTLANAGCSADRQINFEPTESTGKEKNDTEANHYKMGLIIGCSVAAILILVLILAVVLMKRRRESKANLRKSKDENPIYGPRETVYVDEVYLTGTLNFLCPFMLIIIVHR